MTFTLGSLLEQRDLGLRLVVGSPECLSRPIAGAHAIEIANPVRWLDRHWVMLTTGVRLRHSTAEQRQLVQELDRGGITALGFAEEVIFKTVPRAIIEEARKRDFPVFATPYRTPHRSIVSFVNRSLFSNDFYVLQRSISMQNYLMDALGAEHPEAELVTRLGTLLDSTVLIYSSDGRLEESRGEAPAAAIWREIAARSPALAEFTVGRWYVVSIPIAVADVVRNWLALATRRRSVSEQLAAPVIRAAARLLEVLVASRETAAAEARALRAELLRRVLAASADDPVLVDRMSAFGFKPGAACSLAAVAPARPGDADQKRSWTLLERHLAASCMPYLMLEADGRLVVYLEGRGPFEEWLRKLARDGVELVAGIGRTIDSIGLAADSLRDADLALAQLRRDRRPGRVVRFEELDLSTWLVSDLGAERLRPKVDALLAPVRENEILYETLLAYLEHDLDVGRTARALHLHPNSLRYRLAQIEQRLGTSLRSAATIANLHLATLVDSQGRLGKAPLASPRSDGHAPPSTSGIAGPAEIFPGRWEPARGAGGRR
jgi:purine catabolism regulator